MLVKYLRYVGKVGASLMVLPIAYLMVFSSMNVRHMTEKYIELSQTTTMELFCENIAKIVNISHRICSIGF